jgi:hypothetical protein
MQRRCGLVLGVVGLFTLSTAAQAACPTSWVTQPVGPQATRAGVSPTQCVVAKTGVPIPALAEDFGVMPARGTRVFKKILCGRQATTVELVGGGRTNLDLAVYDSRGNLISTDKRPTDKAQVRFRPATTGMYRIVVVNKGVLANPFMLATRQTRITQSQDCSCAPRQPWLSCNR